MSQDMNTAPVWSVIKGVSIIVGNDAIAWDHPQRDNILQAIRDGRFADIPEMIAPVAAVVKYGKGKLLIDGNEVTYNGRVISGLLHNRLLEMVSLDLPINHFLNFLENMELVTVNTVREELYGFLEYGKLPLTQDGCFMARKVVDTDFMDYHSHTVDWSPGNVVSMNRADVDDDRHHLCSTGLHVYSRDYGRSFMGDGGKFLAVKVNPRDVVAIPPDYHNTKMRVCRAEVIKEITTDEDPEFFASLCYTAPINMADNDEPWDEIEAEDEDEDDVADVARYCKSCGKQLVPDNCESLDDIRFCPFCGESL